jgi:predicted nucleotidyltransferase
MKTIQKCSVLNQSEKTLLKKCKQAVMSIEIDAEAVLYGSRARGDACLESDYDLLVLTAGPATLHREEIFRNALFPIELETGAVLTVILLNKNDWATPLYQAMPFYNNVNRDGILL